MPSPALWGVWLSVSGLQASPSAHERTVPCVSQSCMAMCGPKVGRARVSYVNNAA